MADVLIWFKALENELERFYMFVGGPSCPPMVPEHLKEFDTAVGRALDCFCSCKPAIPRLKELRFVYLPGLQFVGQMS